MKIYRSSIWVVSLFALLVQLSGCSQNSPQARTGPPRSTAVPVETTPVQRISIQRQVDLSGTLVSPDEAKVSSEVAGKVVDVLVEIGQEVRAGQELVRLDATELNLALERAESSLRQLEAQLGLDPSRPDQPLPADEEVAAVRTAAANRDDARAQLVRSQELSAKGLLSKADMDTTQTRVKVAEAAYQAAIENVHALKASLQDRRAAYDLAKKKLNDAVIRAPLAGAIAERTVQRGEYIRENTPVVTIVRLDPLKLRTGVQEKYANLIHTNQTVQFNVEPFPGDMFQGRIAFISPAVDQATRTFAAEILVDNAGHKLKPGFFAKGQILLQRDEGVMAVPEQAVSTLAGVSSVFVVENGVVRQQAIQLGEHTNKVVEVLSGLKGDEILAASNLNELVTGSKVSENTEEAAQVSGDDAPANANPNGEITDGFENRKNGAGRRGNQ